MRLFSKATIALLPLLLPGCLMEEASSEDLAGEQGQEAQQALCIHQLTPCTVAANCSGRINVGDKTVPYWRSHPLGSVNPDVTRAVIVLHGLHRDAAGYFQTTINAEQKAQSVDACAGTDTIVLAPKFQRVESPANATDDTPAASDLYWNSDDAWEKGNLSASPGTRFSSYDVVDNMVDKLANVNKFPNLRSIVIAGHSGGGQFAQRYAAGNQRDGKLRPGLSISYVVTNPSSYMYLNNLRPTADDSRFDFPFFCDTNGNNCVPNFAMGRGLCPNYDNYKYGMQHLNTYMAAAGTDLIRSQYPKRRVTYLLGEQDTEDGSAPGSELEVGCQAEYQGKTRLERARTFASFMNIFYAGNSHKSVIVPGIGHSVAGMWSSPNGVQVLFGN